MFVEVKLEEFRPIIELFTKDSGSEVDAYIDKARLFINGDENELMLRINPYTKKLTIARIKFKHTRQGHGNALSKLLTEYALLNNYNALVIESVITQEGCHFALKNGFSIVKEFAFGVYGDYELRLQPSHPSDDSLKSVNH